MILLVHLHVGPAQRTAPPRQTHPLINTYLVLQMQVSGARRAIQTR